MSRTVSSSTNKKGSMLKRPEYYFSEKCIFNNLNECNYSGIANARGQSMENVKSYRGECIIGINFL